MQFVSYWEMAKGKTMPPYVALALVSIQRVLGDAFLLLTPKSTPEYIGTDHLNKNWGFKALNFDFVPSVTSIVAKSDYIRMAYVYQHGGVWLDADTLLFEDPSYSLFPKGLTNKLHWYSEALFGSQPRNLLLGETTTRVLATEAHEWGNPGNIKNLTKNRPEMVISIPNYSLDPGYRPLYNFATCEVMRDEVIAVHEFLSNPGMKLLKLYNTYFSRTLRNLQTVDGFLRSNTLLAKLFLHIDSDMRFWEVEATKLIKHCESENTFIHSSRRSGIR